MPRFYHTLILQVYCSEVVSLSQINNSNTPVKVAIVEKSRIEFFVSTPCHDLSTVREGNWQLVTLDLTEVSTGLTWHPNSITYQCFIGGFE